MRYPKIFNNIRKTAMCPKCYKVFHLKYDEHDPIFDRHHVNLTYTIDSDPNYEYDLVDDFISIRGSFPAPCHPEEELIMLDENIADVISQLNKKGYHTTSCCEGHLNIDEFNQQRGQLFWYIMIRKDAGHLIPDDRVLSLVSAKVDEFDQKFPNSIAVDESTNDECFIIYPYIESEEGLIDKEIIMDPNLYNRIKSYWIVILKKFVDTLPIIQ